MLAELALYSDRLFMATVLVYVLAMVLHCTEYAIERAPAKAAVLVGSGDQVEEQAEPTAPRRADRFGGMALSLTMLGALLHAGSIVLRGLASQRWPLGNMYEFVSAICLAAVVTWLVVQRRSGVARPVGLFVLLPVVILLFLGGTVLYAPAAPVMPALQSYWLVVHVTAITISSGLLLVPGMLSVLYLLRRSGRLTAVTDKLPSADALDRVAYRTTIVAFPLFTFWGWDPKETVAFVSWVIYAAYLHARATAGWRTVRAAWINVVGLASVVFNLFFINMVVAGLHSYAGLG
jgi:cytochrome c-type biogenesis protein CcsB